MDSTFYIIVEDHICIYKLKIKVKLSKETRNKWTGKEHEGGVGGKFHIQHTYMKLLKLDKIFYKDWFI